MKKFLPSLAVSALLVSLSSLAASDPADQL